MRNILILSLFLALTFPSLAPAQTFSIEQQTQIKSIIQQITDLQIQILLAKIAELKAQIAELLTQQTTMAKKVDTIAEGTVTPIVVPIEPPKVIPAVPVITVGSPYCEGDVVLLPVSIEGKWEEALVRVYSEPRSESRPGLDIKMLFHPNDKPFAFGNKSDLKVETSGYKNPSDNSFLNGSTFKYQVSVYNESVANSRGHLDLSSNKFILESSNGTLAEAFGSLTLPVCE